MENEVINWIDGIPEKPGWYLCAFNDGIVEVYQVDEDEFDGEGGLMLFDNSVTASIEFYTTVPIHPTRMNPNTGDSNG